ncbi:hypothetical protein Tco_1435876 [Tanacetum coccineum]
MKVAGGGDGSEGVDDDDDDDDGVMMMMMALLVMRAWWCVAWDGGIEMGVNMVSVVGAMEVRMVMLPSW